MGGGNRGGHRNARRNRLRTVATPGTTSLEVISAGRLPDRRSRPGRALRLVRSRPAALRGSPLASPVRLRWPLRARRNISPGPGAHNVLIHELRLAATELSTNPRRMWTRCGNNPGRTVLANWRRGPTGRRLDACGLGQPRPLIAQSAGHAAAGPRESSGTRSRCGPSVVHLPAVRADVRPARRRASRRPADRATGRGAPDDR